MKLINRNQVDETKWESWCEKSPESQPFLSLDYLDAVSENLVFAINEDESGGMPLSYFEKLGVKTLYTPVFCRWIDWVGDNRADEKELLVLLTDNFKVGDIYFRKESLSVNSENLIYQTVRSVDFKLNQQAKRKLKSFGKTEMKFSNEIEIKKGVGFLQKELSDRIDSLNDSDFRSLEKLLIKFNSNNKLVQISLLENNQLKGTVFLIENAQSILYLKGTCTSEWKNKGGMYALIHEGIQLAFESNRTFDFGGSRVEGVRKFNRCFGGVDQQYFAYSWNKGPLWYKTIKEMKNKWKKR